MLCGLSSAADAATQASNSTPSAPATRVVILGTGSPDPDPDNSGPAVAVVTGGAAYLVDCGPGVVRRAAAAKRKGIAELAVQNIHVVFITHLHSDHTVGYPDLIFTPWVVGRSVPLEAYGPRGLGDMTKYIEKAWEKDIEVRTYDGHAPHTGYEVNVHEIEPGIVYKDKNVTVSAFLVKHGSWDQAFGYKFEAPDRTIVISGDTRPTDAIAKACNHCDVLVHEVYSEARVSKLPPGQQEYSRTFHTSTVELAKEAAAARPRLLVLYHQMYGRGMTYEQLLDEMKQDYSGDVVSARDLDVY
jgi:ribonuclease Z